MVLVKITQGSLSEETVSQNNSGHQSILRLLEVFNASICCFQAFAETTETQSGDLVSDI